MIYELNIYNTVYKFLGGVIDSDYRGDIKVIVVNNGPNIFCYQRGLKIAQFIVEKISHHDLLKIWMKHFVVRADLDLQDYIKPDYN